MGTVCRESYTTPLPAGAEAFTHKGERWLRFNGVDKLAAYFKLELKPAVRRKRGGRP